MKETFNILSLSGGGIKGIFQSTFLKFLEDLYKVPLFQIFDLVAGTSTGSIVGAALACGIPMDEVTSLYKQHGNDIFKKKKVGVKGFRPSWYSNKELKRQLEKVFDRKKLCDANTKLLIPSTSLENYKYNIFTQDGNDSIVDALMSSAAAPFYFDAYQTSGDISHFYMDGGLWANNPTLVAVLYCVNELDVPLDRIRILSIGTSCMPNGNDASHFNSLITANPEKIKSVISAMFNSSESFTHEYSEELVNELNIIHIDPSSAIRSKVELDDVDTAIEELPVIAQNAFEEAKERLPSLLGGEGRNSCSLKRKNYISESALLKVRLADFVPTRTHYRESDKDSKVSDYLKKATKTLRIMSVSLSDGISYHGMCKTLEDLLKKQHELTITISLLDFRNETLIKVMAPILNMSETDLVSKIKVSVKALYDLAFKNKQRLNLYLHNTIPFGTIIALDENLPEGSLIVETRPYKLHSATSFSYKLLNAENSVLFKNIIEGCKNIENGSTKVNKRLVSLWKK